MSTVILEIRRWQLWFPCLLVVIGMVSVWDTYLIVRCQHVIGVTEENPVGRWLLEADGGDIGLFVRTKIAGTVVVLTVLTMMWLKQFRLLFPVITSVASWQSGLMLYLTLY